MAQRTKSLQTRRAERRRKEIRRKKRIRAAFLLICFIAVIVFLIVSISSCVNRKNSERTVAVSTAESVVSPQATQTAVSSASSIPSAKEENNLMKIIEETDENGGEKTCYLTFDDGPSDVTAAILDVLRKYNVKATFFEIGSTIKANRDMAQRVFEEGHLIANHSNNHNYDKLYADSESFITEVNDTEELISEIYGGAPRMKLFRFPGGSDEDSDYADEKRTYKKELKNEDYYYIDWNARIGDSEGRTRDAAGLLSYLQDNIDTSASAVILMHDTSSKTATAEALPSIIEYLISEGYTFKRLDQIDYIASAKPSAASSGSSDFNDASDDDTTDGSTGDDISDSSDNDTSDISDSSTSEKSKSSSDTESSDSESSESGDEKTSSGMILSTPAAGSTTRTSVDGKTVNESR